MTINRSHGYWGKNGTVKAHRKSKVDREALAQPPRVSEYSGNNRRAL